MIYIFGETFIRYLNCAMKWTILYSLRQYLKIDTCRKWSSIRGIPVTKDSFLCFSVQNVCA